MIKFFSFFLFILTFSGCSYLTNKFESINESTSRPTVVLPKNNYCPDNSKIQYINEDESLLKYYKNLNSSIFENKSIPFIQKALMFSLIEMSRRPDESSPYARFQVYLKLNGKTYYFDFRPKNLEDDTKMSHLKGLEILTKKFLPKQSLSSIAAYLDNIVPLSTSVSSEFEKFLKENRTEIIKNEALVNYFIKGDEVLTKYETFNRMSFKTLIQNYQSPLYAKDADYAFDINGLNANKSNHANFFANCNYDLQKEIYQRDELLPNEIKKAHTVGISDGEDYFLAVTSATLYKPFKTSPKLGYFMKARPSPLPLPICEFSSENQDIVLFSSDGRNPIQHLQHLYAYGVNKANSPYALNELLNFSRHLFLSNPDRILYESKRGRKAQLDFFLAMKFPIYHVDTLGNVFAHATFKSNKKIINGLFIDDRSQARLWCK